MELTQEQKNRLCNKDWRVNHLYKIVNKRKEIIPFQRNKAQEHFNKNKWYRNIILKSRQLGFTTDEAIDSLDDCLFSKNNDALLIAHTDKDAIKIFDKKVDFAWKNFPIELKELYKVDTNRSNELKFDFGDGSFSSIAVSNSGRSGTYNRVHISEFAKLCKKFPQKAQEVITGTIPAVPLNGRIDIESTAEGETGEFYEMFWEAWNRGEPINPVEYKAFFYNWTWDEEEINQITQEQIDNFLKSKDYLLFDKYKKDNNLSDREITYYYFKWLSQNKSWSKLRQEYPTTPEEAFMSSGNKLFDQDKIINQLKNVRDGRKVSNWTFYNEYRQGHQYGLGADVSEGIGRDSNTIVVIDFTLKEVVAVYKDNNLSPDLFAYEIRTGGEKYGLCIVAPERNNTGFATITKLKEIYPVENIYKEVRTNTITDKKTDRLGWHTNLATKPKILFDLKTAIEEELLTIPDKGLLNEMKVYDKEELNIIKSDEETTNHFDLLMACAIAYEMRNHVIMNVDDFDDIIKENEDSYVSNPYK